MGGLLILGSCIFSTLLWADLNNYFIWISLLVLLIYGTTGFVDFGRHFLCYAGSLPLQPDNSLFP